MTPINFCYWLQGYLELSDPEDGLTAEQVNKVKAHIALVMTCVTDKPTAPGSFTESRNSGLDLLKPIC